MQDTSLWEVVPQIILWDAMWLQSTVHDPKSSILRTRRYPEDPPVEMYVTRTATNLIPLSGIINQQISSIEIWFLRYESMVEIVGLIKVD